MMLIKKEIFPIEEILPQLIASFTHTKNIILSAPPGAGKTTQVPIALLNSEILKNKKIIMLEPRRLAARRAAEFMSAQLDEKVGQTIGYRIRGESVVSRNTRIEVVTEGILTRLLQHEPDLPGVGAIIFDEFHERSIHADLGLAFAIDIQENLREDLRILIMSATLDGATISKILSNAKIIDSKGKIYPITTHYSRFTSEKQLEVRIVATILRVLQEEEGDILVFLPGQKEIKRIENLLWEKNLPEDVLIHSLFGDASYQQQSIALTPAPSGKRKVILSTSIAETSLTIDGVRIVIDSGLARTARFDVRRGMSGLVTIPVSKAVADQRRGRAGRQQPGVCYRLWTESEHESLPDYPQPEIKVADLASLALNLVRWGTPDGANLKFLDPPPEAHLLQAQKLLKELGAVDASGKLTEHGRAMAELPIHPRLSNMILRGKKLGLGTLACDVAAILEERDMLSGIKDKDIDLESRVHALYGKSQKDSATRERIIAQSQRLKDIAKINKTAEKKNHSLGLLLALAYPDRIAKKREPKKLRYLMTSGTTASLPVGSLLAREEFIAIGEVDGIGTEVRIFLAAPISQEEILDVFVSNIIEEAEIRWNPAEETVIARNILRFGALVLSEKNITPSGDEVVTALIDGIRQMGLNCLPWDKESRSLQQRCEWLRSYQHQNDLPDLSEQNLLNTLEIWLSPFLNGIWKREQLKSLSLLKILQSHIFKSVNHKIDKLAPSHIKLPSGTNAFLDYSSGQPILAVKLQELFGQVETPKIVDGKINILIHLLSPANRPLAVTQDLKSFWKNIYLEIRTQMRSRYPKHFWPEDPLTAKPTNRTIRKKH